MPEMRTEVREGKVVIDIGRPPDIRLATFEGAENRHFSAHFWMVLKYESYDR